MAYCWERIHGSGSFLTILNWRLAWWAWLWLSGWEKFLWAVVELAQQLPPGTCFRNWGKLFLGGVSLCGLCYKPWLRGSAGGAAGGLDAAGRDVLCGDLVLAKPHRLHEQWNQEARAFLPKSLPGHFVDKACQLTEKLLAIWQRKTIWGPRSIFTQSASGWMGSEKAPDGWLAQCTP